MKSIVSSLVILAFSIMPIMGASDTNGTLTTKRTYGKDVWGYSQREKNLATNILENKLYPQKKEIEERIKDLINTPEKAQELKESKRELEKINQNIDNQEVIAGKKSSNLRKGALYALSGAALLGALVTTYSYLSYGTVYHEVSKIGFEGGLSNYLRNRIVGEPYRIRPVSELEFWNRDAHEWQPVAGNEELAKRSFVKSPYDHTAVYWKYDDGFKTMLPRRGDHYFWDPEINAFRLVTIAEAHYQGLSMKHALEWLDSDRKIKSGEGLGH